VVYRYKYFSSFQLFVSAIIIILFIGFRGFLYTDWQGYYNIYKKSPSLFDGLFKMRQFVKELSEKLPFMEKGFLVYLILCKTISQNYFFLQAFSFIIDFFILFEFFKKYIPQYVILGFLFFFLFSGISIEFNLLRNAKAIMIFLLSIKYIYGKNILRYFLLIILSSLFHISALLYLPLYFVINRKFHKVPIFIIFIIGNIIYLFQIRWCKFMLLSVSSLLSGGRLDYLLELYLSSEKYSQSYGITVGYLERFFSFIIVYIFSDKIYKTNKENLIFIDTFYIYSFIFLYFSEISILLERVAVLFVFGYWIIYPQIYALLSKNYKKVFLLFLLVYGILKMAGNNNLLTEYDNILFEYKSYDVRRNRVRYYIEKTGDL
jgi:hypothetical protein